MGLDAGILQSQIRGNRILISEGVEGRGRNNGMNISLHPRNNGTLERLSQEDQTLSIDSILAFSSSGGDKAEKPH